MNFVLEFCGCLSSKSNGIAVNEIEVYDNQNNKYDITNIEGYDTVAQGEPHYWGSNSPNGSWNHGNLTDGTTAFSTNNSAFFLYKKTNLQLRDIGRISFDTDDLCTIVKVYYGTNSEDRTPKVINLYKLKDEYKDESLNFYNVIRSFNNYTDYYDLIESVDTTDLYRLNPIEFKIVPNAEIDKSVIRPSDDILIDSGIEMTNYKILDYSTTEGANPECLFNKKIGHWPPDAFDWGYESDYLKIQINKPCNLYIHLDSNYLDQHNQLNITPNTFEEQHALSSLRDWQLYVSGIQPGIYTFKNNGEYRCDVEWFFEEIKTSSDDNTEEGNTEEIKGPSEKIKTLVKDKILNHELFNSIVFESE